MRARRAGDRASTRRRARGSATTCRGPLEKRTPGSRRGRRTFRVGVDARSGAAYLASTPPPSTVSLRGAPHGSPQALSRWCVLRPFPARARRAFARARARSRRVARLPTARACFFSAREALQRKISSPRRGRRRRLDAAAIARARVRASRCPRDASETAFTTRPGWTTAADAANCASTDARVLGLSPASSSHLRQRALTPSSPRSPRLAAVPKDVQDQEDPGQEAEAEQAHPPVDPHAHRQHHQVRVRGDPSRPLLRVEKFQDLGQEIDRSIDPRRERPTDRPPPSSFSHRSSGTTPSVATGAAPSSASDRCDGPGRGLTVWTVHGAVAPLARD